MRVATSFADPINLSIYGKTTHILAPDSRLRPPSPPGQASSIRAALQMDIISATRSPAQANPTLPVQPISNDSFSMPPASLSDQACKECRRRKARCNRTLPVCGLCAGYKRHCLYEKYARTPLTRRHLTEVEERLERAEALIRRMSSLVPPQAVNEDAAEQSESCSAPEPIASDPLFDFATAPSTQQSRNANEHQKDIPQAPSTASASASRNLHSQRARAPADMGISAMSTHQIQDHESQRMLESPPLYNFEWSEKEADTVHNLSLEAVVDTRDESSPISDGMASLTVSEREGGYLGVASGAAMLRILEPEEARRSAQRSQSIAPTAGYALPPQPNPNRHITETMIDAYFTLYHVSYPIIHEPTFRAQYSEVIPRPNGPCWTVLAYVVAAIGVWASSTTVSNALDIALFNKARSMLNFDFLEVGNLSLVQALTLASNYQQKRDKPNSGYNYLGLAVRMALGLGLHKEFQGWNISPLNMEIRRRVWWSLCVFDVGATITFSRPDVWPYNGVDVCLPMNVDDKDLTAASQAYPDESNQPTPYTAVATQARFHIAAHLCYDKIISRPFPSAQELLRLDADHVEPWRTSVPSFFAEGATVSRRYTFCHAVMAWRLRNLRIIMYRPFVVRRALLRQTRSDDPSSEAYRRCLVNAQSTIQMIEHYWDNHERNRLSAWYSLYFLFQAALIPCICLRNNPGSPEASDWRDQISSTLRTITALSSYNPSSSRCHQVIFGLCGRYLAYQQEGQQEHHGGTATNEPTNVVDDGTTVTSDTLLATEPVGESPQTQINNVINMMWPNVHPIEATDMVMDDATGWMQFLNAGSDGMWDMPDT